MKRAHEISCVVCCLKANLPPPTAGQRCVRHVAQEPCWIFSGSLEVACPEAQPGITRSDIGLFCILFRGSCEGTAGLAHSAAFCFTSLCLSQATCGATDWKRLQSEVAISMPELVEEMLKVMFIEDI